MLQEDAHNLMLGTKFDSTFLHYIEEHFRVPYRYDKIFAGTIRKKTLQYQASYVYYVRNLELDPQPCLDRLLQKVTEQNALKTSGLGAGTIMTVKSKDLFHIAAEMLQKDPCVLVKVGTRISE